MNKIEDLYILADGTQADPSDVARGDDGVFRHKNGIAVAQGPDGKPLTVGHQTAMNAAAAGKSSTSESQTAAADDREEKIVPEKSEPVPATKAAPLADAKTA